jgi:hypothetical protein
MLKHFLLKVCNSSSAPARCPSYRDDVGIFDHSLLPQLSKAEGWGIFPGAHVGACLSEARA